MQFKEGFVVSDGKQLLLKWGATDSYFFAESYLVTSLSISHDTFDVVSYGSPSFQAYARPPILDLGITSGHFKPIEKEDALRLFRTVDSMSVNELLAAAYQKMNARQS